MFYKLYTFLLVHLIGDNVVNSWYSIYPCLPLLALTQLYCTMGHYQILECLVIHILKKWLSCDLSHLWLPFCLAWSLQEAWCNHPQLSDMNSSYNEKKGASLLQGISGTFYPSCWLGGFLWLSLENFRNAWQLVTNIWIWSHIPGQYMCDKGH